MSEPDIYCWDAVTANFAMTRPAVREIAMELESGRQALMWAGVVREMDEHPERYELADLALADSLSAQSTGLLEASLRQAVAIHELEIFVLGRYIQIQADRSSGNG